MPPDPPKFLPTRALRALAPVPPTFTHSPATLKLIDNPAENREIWQFFVCRILTGLPYKEFKVDSLHDDGQQAMRTSPVMMTLIQSYSVVMLQILTTTKTDLLVMILYIIHTIYLIPRGRWPSSGAMFISPSYRVT